MAHVTLFACLPGHASVSKPAPQSFNAFLQRWLADQVGEQREQTRRSSGSGAGGTWGALITYVNDQLEGEGEMGGETGGETGGGGR